MTDPIELGPFELLSPAEAGGMGEVWHARHKLQDHPVAVKIFSYPNPREEILAAFRNEARAVARLSHPHIVRLFDYGEITPLAHEQSGGALGLANPYLVMEYLSGGILQVGAPFNYWEKVSGLLATLLESLSHAHARGVLHRDLKPGNILFGSPEDWRPGVKLIDFGLARDRDIGGGLGPGLRAGTPGFAAPEQFGRVNTFEQGPWTDLFSLGCIAFHLVTQKLPFIGETLDESLAACKAGDRQPLDYNFEVPEGLSVWLDRLLGYHPSARYQCAADALYGLEHLSSIQSASSSSVCAALPAHWEYEHGEQESLALGNVGVELFGLRRPPITKRVSERSRIWEALGEVSKSGQPQALILTGAAGTGKSRLAQWMTERADELGAATIFRATHSPAHGPLEGLAGMFARHFGCMGLVWSQVLVRLQNTICYAGDRSMREVITIGELIRPALAGSKRKKSQQRHFDSPEERYEAMRHCLRDASGSRPLIVWLDDAQWGRDTLEFVRHVLEHSGSASLPVLFLLTVRDDDFDESNKAFVHYQSLLEREDSHYLHLAPLTDDDLDELLQGMLSLSDEVSKQVKARSGGNPLFALQLVGDWVERKILQFEAESYELNPKSSTGVPDTIHEIWMNRVNTLLSSLTRGQTAKKAKVIRTQANHALELAACLGQDVDGAEWKGLCEKQKLDASEMLLDSLLKSGLASSTEGGWRFEHPLLRESLERASEDFGQSSYHHQMCANYLDEHLAPGEFTSLGRVAGHLIEASLYEDAASRLLEAARLAVDCGEFSSADEYLGMRDGALDALHTSPTDSLRIAGWLGRINRWCTQNQKLDEALLLVRQVVDAACAQELKREHGLGLFYQGVIADHEGDHVGAQNSYNEAFALLAQEGSPEELALAYYVRARSLYYLGELSEALKLCTEATKRYRDVGDDFGAARCSDVMAKVYRADGDFGKALEVTEAARVDFEKLGYRAWEALAWTTLGEIKRLSEDLNGADACYEQSIALWDEIGSQKVFYPRLNQAFVLLKRAKFCTARERFQALMEIAGPWGLGWTIPGLHLGLLGCAAGEAQWERFDAHLEAASSLLGEQGSALDEYALLYEYAGDLAGGHGEPARQKKAYVYAAQQWEVMNYDKRVKELELKFPPGV